MTDLLREAAQAGQDAYATALREGIAIGKRESAQAVAELREMLSMLLNIDEYADRFNGAVMPNNDTRRIQSMARTLIAKHAPPMLRDENPAKYSQLRTDAIREQGDTK